MQPCHAACHLGHSDPECTKRNEQGINNNSDAYNKERLHHHAGHALYACWRPWHLLKQKMTKDTVVTNSEHCTQDLPHAATVQCAPM
jgi:hypothetical protein